MPYADPQVKRDYQRKYVRRNRARINTRRNETGVGRENGRRRREAAQLLLLSYKERPCHDCDNEFPHYCMEFDHCRGKKLFNLGSLRTLSLPKIRAELQKCDVVCVNCHKKRTYRRLMRKRK